MTQPPTPTTPEDLAEAWHLIVASGGEPIEWQMDSQLWDEVKRAAEQRATIDAGDHLTEVGDLCLLGTPVSIGRMSVPILRYRTSEGEDVATPILPDSQDPSPAIARAHGRGTAS